jgi:phage baseplate assembly protein V
MAGNERGWVMLPEVGDEVLVAFLQGDINNAIVVGALFNGKDKAPYANADGKNNLRMFKSRSGHTVTFDDSNGGEKIEMVTSNEAVKVTYDAAGKKLSVVCKGDIELEAAQGFKVSCMDFEVKAKSGVTLEATGNAKLAGASTTVEGKAKVGVTAPSISLG